MQARARTTTRWALELRRRLRQGSRRPPVASVVRPHRHPDRAPQGRSPPNRATPLMATRVLRALYFVPSRCTRTPLKSCISPDFMLSIRLASPVHFASLHLNGSLLHSILLYIYSVHSALHARVLDITMCSTAKHFRSSSL